MQNLQLTLTLGSGVALGHPWINGEGLIERLALIDAKGKEYDRFVAELDESGPRDLRAAGIVDTGLAYTDDIAHASASQFSTDQTATTTLYSSYDEVRAHSVGGSRPRTKIPIGGGAFKSQMIDVVYRPARYCWFYFRGDRDRIEALLADHLTDLGKHTARGFGKVEDWALTELETDTSLIHPDGLAMRPIPTDRLDGYSESSTLTYQTPYHYQRWATECAPPGAEVEPVW